MFESLRHLFEATSPEAAAVIGLIEVVTLIGLAWLVAQAVGLRRDRRLLERVRALFETDPLREAAPWDFAARWTAAGGPELPQGWVTDRVRGLMEVKAAGQGGAEALRDLAERRAEQQTEVPRYIAAMLVLLGLA